MAINIETLDFGSGNQTEVLNDPEFNALDTADQARALGRINGCPVPEELIAARGAEAMRNRYGELNYWFNYIVKQTRAENPALYEQLVSPLQRKADEPAGKHEPESVPAAFAKEIAPTAVLANFALPKVLIKQMDAQQPGIKTQQRLAKAVESLDSAIPQAKTPEQLLALVSEELTQANVSPVDTLKAILSTSWCIEHNAYSLVGNVKAALSADAPKLWSVYISLTPKEKTKYGIV